MRAHSFTTKRGRPATSTPEDKANLRHGTPENQRKRLELVKGADPRYSAWPLGILLARGLVTEDQARAGGTHAWAHSMALGRKAHAKSILGTVVASTGGAEPGWVRHLGDLNGDDRLTAITQAVREANDKLLRAGRDVHQRVIDTAVMETPLWWLDHHIHHDYELKLLRIGLDILAPHWFVWMQRI